MRLGRWFAGNRIQLLQGGEEYFPLLLDAIYSAKEEILFEIYIFHDDEIGKKVKRALIEASQRGVRVSVVMDGVGCVSLSQDFYHELRSAKVEVFVFRPVRFFPKFRNIISERMHRKVVVIDSEVAFVGGMNISEEQLFSHPTRARMDHAVRVEGPLVKDIRSVLIQFRYRLRKRWRLWRRSVEIFPEPNGKISQKPVRAAFLIRDNFRHRRHMEKHFISGVWQAKKTIDIAVAYFLPSGRLLRALEAAARRGVRVRLILEGKAEFFWLKWASDFLYPRLLGAGIEIYEYQPYILHSKVVSIDSQWTSIGSCNLEPISLTLNLEANVVVEDIEFAKEVERKLEQLRKDSKHIRRDQVANTPWWLRVHSWVSYVVLRFLSRILLGAV